MNDSGKKSQQMSVSEATSRLISLILKMSPEEIFATLERLEAREEKRKAPRIDYFMPLDYVVGNRLYSGFINNISTSGVYVESGEIFEVGETITLTFPLPKSGEHIKVNGRIVRMDATGFGVAFDVDLVTVLQETERDPEAFRFPDAWAPARTV